jgi:hypothetical protein
MSTSIIEVEPGVNIGMCALSNQLAIEVKWSFDVRKRRWIMLNHRASRRRQYYTCSMKLDAIAGWGSNQSTLNIFTGTIQYRLLFCCSLTKRLWMVKAKCKDNKNGYRRICSELILMPCHFQYSSSHVSSLLMIKQIRSHRSCTRLATLFFIGFSKRLIIGIRNSAACSNLASQHSCADTSIYSSKSFTSSWIVCA